MNLKKNDILIPFILTGLILVSRFIFPHKMTFLTEVAIFTIYVMGNNILYGYLGYVSFGQPFYLGMGAYAAALYLAYIGHNPLVAILVAVCYGMLLGIILGSVFIRLRGSYFALVNAALCAIGTFLLEKVLINLTRGSDGLWYRSRMSATPIIDIRLPGNLFYFILLVLLIVFLLYRYMDKSALGVAFRAVQSDNSKMKFMGYNTFKIRWAGFTLAAMLSALAGSLYAVNFGFVNPNLGENSRAIEVLVATILGGAGSVYGPLFGAVAFLGIKDIVSHWITHWELVVGILTITVLFRFSKGIWGSIETLFNRIHLHSNDTITMKGEDK